MGIFSFDIENDRILDGLEAGEGVFLYSPRSFGGLWQIGTHFPAFNFSLKTEKKLWYLKVIIKSTVSGVTMARVGESRLVMFRRNSAT